VLLRSGAESSQLSQVLSGDGWWTATRTTTNLTGAAITRQERIVYGVLAGAVLAGQVGWVVQPVRSCGAEYARLE
jgi:hypothetical protein